jgi:guanylate kinase
MQPSLAEKLQSYKPSQATAQLISSTPILLLVGPTGAGKDTLKEKLLKTGNYHHIVSHTTRPPRINHGIPEKDGVDYHFIDKATAEKMIDNQEFVEAKIYSDNLYGTSAAEIQKAKVEKKIAMTDVEVQGVAEYQAIYPGIKAIFLLPPSFEEWQARLGRRYGDVVDAEDHRLRLQTALTELEQLMKTDYYIPVINDDVDSTYKHIKDIMEKGEVKSDTVKTRELAVNLAQSIQDYLNKLGAKDD